MAGKGILAVISGFSGVGKGTVIRRLLEGYDYHMSISATTRSPRKGEQDGREYFFLSQDEFETMIAQGQFIEYAQYVGNYYGTPRKYVMQQLEQGHDVILEIEMQGALLVRDAIPEADLIFLAPPSVEELERRLRGRGTESEEAVRRRLERAGEECSYMEKYDYILVNDDLDTCVRQMHNLIRSLHFKREQQEDLIRRIAQDLKKI